MYTIRRLSYRKSATFNTNVTTYELKFTHNMHSDHLPDIYKHIYDAIEMLLHYVLSQAGSRDLIRIVLHNQDLDYPIQIPFMKKENVSAELFLSEIECVLQSFEEFTIDELLLLTVS